ncbi:class I adenylate-forming enzyme family protein, partial [Methylicorpusculum sp.]|uniref:class I adenylate-forming enzyme family protein n=1 Tax=Methylicorpusculum sp. TaxID=2713644 RepID=UPI002AB91248
MSVQSLYKKVYHRLTGDLPAYVSTLRAEIFKDGKTFFLGSLLKRSAQLHPDEVALIYLDKKITYKELYSRAVRLSELLREKGVRPHDRVLLFFENSIEFYIAYYGIIQLGAVVAPLNTFLKEAELTHIINDASPVLLITIADKVTHIRSMAAASTLAIMTEQDMRLAEPVPAQLPEFQVHELAPDQMIALLYTSGTTGMPKGVMLSSRNCMTNVFQIVSCLHLHHTDRIFGVLPLFHSFAQSTCVWAMLFVGASVIVVPKIERRYILSGLQHKPTFFMGIPALFGLMCLLKNAPLDSVKYFFSGGDALPDRIRAAFALIYRRKLCNGYGLTEASPVIAVDYYDESVPTSTIGWPVLGVSCEIRDEQGAVLPQGEIGTLWVKGDNIMLGYYNAPEQTAKVLKDGWLDTGDLAYFDAKGRIVITGRLKDLIINKGFNIYPQEIENVIVGHPAVIRAAVIGKASEMEGEVPVAFVQVRKEEAGLEKVLRDLCVQHLAMYKVPREFIITAQELPAT